MFGTQHNSVPKTWVLEVPHSNAFVKLCKNLAKIEEKPYSICSVQKTRGCFSSLQTSCNNSEAQYDDGLTTFKKS